MLWRALLGIRTFPSARFLVWGKGLRPPELQKGEQLHWGSEGTQETKERKSNNSAGPDSAPPGGRGEQSDGTLSTSTGTSPPRWKETFKRLSRSTWTPDWLEPEGCWLRPLGPLFPPHQPTRGRSYTLQPSPQILPMKTLPPKPSRTSDLLSTSCPDLLTGPCYQPYSTPNNHDSVCLASLCVGHMKSGLPKISAAKPHLRGNQLESSHSECQKIPFRAARRPVSWRKVSGFSLPTLSHLQIFTSTQIYTENQQGPSWKKNTLR